MKKTGIFSLLIVLAISSFAQSDNWFLSFSMGGSWPLENFKQASIDNSSSGYALKGFHLMLDATYPLSDHWGLKGGVMLNTSPVDRNGLGAKLESRLNPVGITIADADRQFLSLKSNSWMWNALLTGPVYTFNFNRIYWDFQLLGGMNVTYLPQQKLLYEKPANNWYYVDRNTNNMNVSYGILAGTALRFPISNRLNFKIAFDYYASRAIIKFEQIKVTKQGETLLTEKLKQGSASVPMSVITGSVGFVYYLD
jgi:hypothetical protein